MASTRSASSSVSREDASLQAKGLLGFPGCAGVDRAARASRANSGSPSSAAQAVTDRSKNVRAPVRSPDCARNEPSWYTLWALSRSSVPVSASATPSRVHLMAAGPWQAAHSAQWAAPSPTDATATLLCAPACRKSRTAHARHVRAHPGARGSPFSRVRAWFRATRPLPRRSPGSDRRSAFPLGRGRLSGPVRVSIRDAIPERTDSVLLSPGRAGGPIPAPAWRATR